MATNAVVVTGASTGIGLGIARVLTRKGFSVFGSVRNQADANRLQNELGPAFTPLMMDVTDQQAVFGAADRVAESLGNATSWASSTMREFHLWGHSCICHWMSFVGSWK